MIARHLTRALRRAALQNPVITLIGPRQSGKTTLVRSVFSGHRYTSLEAPDTRARALSDPRGVLSAGDPVILGKIQRAPKLPSYVQALVDEDPRPGRFIVTGSQNILLMESVSQTLAGRTALLRLHPFSLVELHGLRPWDPRELDRSFGASAEKAITVPSAASPRETLVTGFCPPVHDRSLPAREWLGDYLPT